MEKKGFCRDTDMNVGPVRLRAVYVAFVVVVPFTRTTDMTGRILQSQGLPPGSSHDIVVAVIDSGVDYTHPDLAAHIWTNSRESGGNSPPAHQCSAQRRRLTGRDGRQHVCSEIGLWREWPGGVLEVEPSGTGCGTGARGGSSYTWASAGDGR